MLTITTSFLLFLSTVTANRTDILPQDREKTAIVEAAITPLEFDATLIKAPIIEDQLASYVRSYFSKNPILAEIAWCESRFRQFTKEGEVFRGRVVAADIGIMQVNEYYHKSAADKLGFDIYTVDGNLSYAQWLYDRQGTQPWSASSPCWES